MRVAGIDALFHYIGRGGAEDVRLYDALVADKYFSGVDPVAVKAELGFDKSTWVYDGRIDQASYDRGAKPWYRKGTDIPPTKYQDIVEMSFLDAAQAKYK